MLLSMFLAATACPASTQPQWDGANALERRQLLRACEDERAGAAPAPVSLAPAPSTGVRVAVGLGVGLGTAAALVGVGVAVGAAIEGRAIACSNSVVSLCLAGAMIAGVVGLVVGPLVGWLVGWSFGRRPTTPAVTLVPVITPAQAGLGIVLGL